MCMIIETWEEYENAMFTINHIMEEELTEAEDKESFDRLVDAVIEYEKTYVTGEM